MNAKGWIAGLLCLWMSGCAQTPTVHESGDLHAVESIAAGAAEAPIERAEASSTLPLKQIIRIDNPFGDVRVRFGGYESVLEWRSVAQNAAAAQKLQVNSSVSDAFVLAARLPAGITISPGQRLDLTAYVPEGHDLQIITEQGLIEVRGLHANLHARSRSGDISFRGIKGLIDVETGSGNIEGQLDAAPSVSQQRVATQTGNILLGLIEELNASLTMATSGVFATEFSIQIDPQPGQEPNKSAHAEIGKPEADIEIVSKRGEIRLLRRLGFQPA